MKALLIVDIQKGLTGPNKLFEEEKFIETVNFAIKKYRSMGYLLVFVQHVDKYLASGTKNWEVDGRIDKNNEDISVQKCHQDAFKKTELKTLLQEKGVRDILVCGLATPYCIKSTCRGGIKHGFSTSLLANGHTNWEKNAQKKIDLVEAKLKKLGVKTVGKQELV